ncbi:unnamed protein product [Mytilus edulis]|uniref:DZIP3-like HEPN domain-containing protein n=1 Tax=Mytilus edulis TaxID=6550 RepID=A0A8S3SAW6_MYTED|nr:unnamed protein product [Mytilus edulis]
MDKEDKQRYFIVGSVYLEVVTPLFQQKLADNYKSLNFSCLKDFLDDKEVIHILFHLRHRNAWCCTDQTNCRNNKALPLNHHQWKHIYDENKRPGLHNCFCKYTAKSVNPEDLDVSLCGLILFNCIKLGQRDQRAVYMIRRNKNDYLSHNTTCGITKDEYDSLMDELKISVFQLDHTKEDELIRIQNRPLDEALCNKYMTTLLNIHEVLEKIDTNTTETLRCVQQILKITQSLNKQSSEEKTGKQGTLYVVTKSNTVNMLKERERTIFIKFPSHSQLQIQLLCLSGGKKNPIKTDKLGQPMFTLHHQIDMKTVVGDDWNSKVTDLVMMDDGRLVVCLPLQSRLLMCNTNGLQVDTIDMQGRPAWVAVVNNCTVAVTLSKGSKCIEMYDINTKRKMKSISVPGMWLWSNITSRNNKLVVGGEDRLLIIDHHTEEVVQTIQTDCQLGKLNGSGDRIFYCDNYNNNKLYWYSYTDDRHHILTLPSRPLGITTLQDGSLYVRCQDESLQHVSSDGTQYKRVQTFQCTAFEYGVLHYNFTQRKLVIRHNNLVEVFNEL